MPWCLQVFIFNITILISMFRVAIVDDDPRLAKALKSELLQFGEIDSVYTCNSGTRFLSELRDMIPVKRPQVVIMDISMSTPDEGIVITGKITREFSDIAVIIFTVSDEDDQIFEAFKAGALGYLLKDEKPEFILKTILDVMNGGSQMSPGIARKAIHFFSSATEPPPATPQEKGTLTDRELEVLRLVAEGVTYPEIAERLSVATSTIKKHMAHIFQKLHVNNKTMALRESRGLF